VAVLQHVWLLDQPGRYDSLSGHPSPPPRKCSVCRRENANLFINYVLVRPLQESLRAEKACTFLLTDEEWSKYERRIVYECSLYCHLVNQSRMLPPVFRYGDIINLCTFFKILIPFLEI
jgi:hypothetical protein